MVRGREFNYSFGLSLLVGLAVAFFGAADALTSDAARRAAWTFVALMACLAFSAWPSCRSGRSARCATSAMEQTLELITLTALSRAAS